MRAVIIANGILDDHNRVLSQLKQEDLLIAADGGSEHYNEIGIRPDIVIGDMDSISTDLMDKFQSSGTKFIIHPSDKDQTDLELALSYAQQSGADEVIFFGILGGRFDLSLSNILLIARDEWKPLSLVIINGPDTAFLLRSKDSISIKGKPGDLVSLIPVSEVVEGVSTGGLRWQLNQAVLLQGNTRSVSNELITGLAEVKIEMGKLLLVHRNIPIENNEE